MKESLHSVVLTDKISKIQTVKLSGYNTDYIVVLISVLSLGLRLMCVAGGYPPNILQPTEAYCTNPALDSPLHLQRRSTSDDVRGLY
jgi:hypothetical protein